VTDYYDRLEVQLMQATARPLSRARRAVVLGRPRGDLFAAAAALAVLVAVAAIFIGLRSSTRPVAKLPAQRGLAVVHNYGNRAMPAIANIQCEIRLRPPAQARPFTAPNVYLCKIHNQPGASSGASGTASVGVVPGGAAFSVDVSGLQRSPPGGDYALWLLSGTTNRANRASLIPDRKPTFLGIVTPPVGPGGRLRAQGLVPLLSIQQPTGHYLFVISRQARLSNTSLGRIVLEGWMSF
jgi:hypothetical protein